MNSDDLANVGKLTAGIGTMYTLVGSSPVGIVARHG